MKIFPLLLLVALIGNTSVSYAQKLKKSGILVKHVLPPLDTTYVNKKFVYKLTDRNYNAQNKLVTSIFKSGDISRAGQTPPYHNSFRYVRKFTSQKYEALDYSNPETSFSYMEVNIDAIQQLPNRQIKTVNLKENGQIVGQSHNYIIQFQLPKSLHFFDQNEELFFESDGNEVVTTTFLFPSDFKLPNNQRLSGCSSVAQLNLMISNLHVSIAKQAKEKIVETWNKLCLSAINTTMNESNAVFPYALGYIKFGKKAGHPEFLKGIEIMEVMNDSIKANFKLKNTANWHSEGVQTLARESNAIWEQILKFEKEDAGGGVLDPLMTAWITKNWIMTQFILGEMDTAITEAQIILDRVESERYLDKLYMEGFIEFAVDYKKRYERNALKYGWQ